MTTEQFKYSLKAQPFRPFSIHLADGRDFRIDHPEMASQSPGGRLAIIWTTPESAIFVDLLLVTSLEPVPTSR